MQRCLLRRCSIQHCLLHCRIKRRRRRPRRIVDGRHAVSIYRRRIESTDRLAALDLAQAMNLRNIMTTDLLRTTIYLLFILTSNCAN